MWEQERRKEKYTKRQLKCDVNDDTWTHII